MQKKKKEIKTCFPICPEEKRMKLLVFTLHFWLKRSCRINNIKDDDKHNNTDTR